MQIFKIHCGSKLDVINLRILRFFQYVTIFAIRILNFILNWVIENAGKFMLRKWVNYR